MKCTQCGQEMKQKAPNNWVCCNCGIGILNIEKFNESIANNISTIKVRNNYNKVISALYRALYNNEPLTDDELKLIIDYVMEEYK